jgi:hypothetical protein
LKISCDTFLRFGYRMLFKGIKLSYKLWCFRGPSASSYFRFQQTSLPVRSFHLRPETINGLQFFFSREYCWSRSSKRAYVLQWTFPKIRTPNFMTSVHINCLHQSHKPINHYDSRQQNSEHRASHWRRVRVLQCFSTTFKNFGAKNRRGIFCPHSLDISPNTFSHGGRN